MSKQRKDKFNLYDGQCEWPIYLHTDNIVSECRFPIEDLKVFEKNEYGTIKIVKLPKGTSIYHKTRAGLANMNMNVKSTEWWNKSFPSNKSLGGVFFSTSKKHIERNIGGTHILEYKTKRPVMLIYIQNIYKFCGAPDGNVFVKHCFPSVLKQLEIESDYNVEGYIGCNECELFLNENSISSIIPMEPVKIDIDRFID